jgi:hypothetical protein
LLRVKFKNPAEPFKQQQIEQLSKAKLSTESDGVEGILEDKKADVRLAMGSAAAPRRARTRSPSLRGEPADLGTSTARLGQDGTSATHHRHIQTRGGVEVISNDEQPDAGFAASFATPASGDMGDLASVASTSPTRASAEIYHSDATRSRASPRGGLVEKLTARMNSIARMDSMDVASDTGDIITTMTSTTTPINYATSPITTNTTTTTKTTNTTTATMTTTTNYAKTINTTTITKTTTPTATNTILYTSSSEVSTLDLNADAPYPSSLSIIGGRSEDIVGTIGISKTISDSSTVTLSAGSIAGTSGVQEETERRLDARGEFMRRLQLSRPTVVASQASQESRWFSIASKLHLGKLQRQLARYERRQIRRRWREERRQQRLAGGEEVGDERQEKSEEDSGEDSEEREMELKYSRMRFMERKKKEQQEEQLQSLPRSEQQQEQQPQQHQQQQQQHQLHQNEQQVQQKGQLHKQHDQQQQETHEPREEKPEEKLFLPHAFPAKYHEQQLQENGVDDEQPLVVRQASEVFSTVFINAILCFRLLTL